MTDFPACPAPFNMAAHVLRYADRLAEKVALEVIGGAQPERWTYAHLKSAVLGTGTGLLAAGLRPGDTVLMRLSNTVDFPIAYLGALAVGLVPAPTAAALTTTEVSKIIKGLAPSAVILDPTVACPDHPNTIDRNALRDMRDLPSAHYQMGDPNRVGYIIHTSGTAGQPKAVVHAHRAIWARQMMFEGWEGLSETDRLLHAGAFNWTYTLGTGLMDPWTVGATALIPTAGTDAQSLPALLANHEATIFAAAPGVYRQILQAENIPALPALRHGLSAGEKLPLSVREKWEATTGKRIYEAYGMSECSTFISSSPMHPAAPETLGRPQIGRRIAILGADGTPRPTGQEGTIAVHHTDPGLMLGYRNADQPAFNEWFATGDQGVMDADGQIAYLGRADDMMNAGGFRVSPIEVEEALSDFPDLSAIAVTQVEIKPDVFVIAAFYTSAIPLDTDALAAFAQEKLARYKQPRLYLPVQSLPSGPNGKLQRATLRREYEANRHG